MENLLRNYLQIRIPLFNKRFQWLILETLDSASTLRKQSITKLDLHLLVNQYTMRVITTSLLSSTRSLFLQSVVTNIEVPRKTRRQSHV